LKHLRYLLIVGTAVAIAAIWTSLALGGSAHQAKTHVVVAKDDGISFEANKSITDTVYFDPGTLEVASGDSITFKFGDTKAREPHTLTVVKKSDLPTNGEQVENCKPCMRYATPHLKNPRAEPGPSNPIVHWILNKGKPGLDAVGDSVAIEQPGKHKSITIRVTAPKDTTLYFVCAVHPWMQGKIVVK
jgi:plastocyanin